MLSNGSPNRGVLVGSHQVVSYHRSRQEHLLHKLCHKVKSPLSQTLHAGIMGFQYDMKAFPGKDTAIIAYQFFFRDKNHDVPQSMTGDWLIERNAYLSFELWSESHRLIHKFSFLPVDPDGTKNIILPAIEAGECVATVILHIGGSVEELSGKIFIPPTVEHTISSYYFEC